MVIEYSVDYVKSPPSSSTPHGSAPGCMQLYSDGAYIILDKQLNSVTYNVLFVLYLQTTRLTITRYKMS